MEKRKKKPSVHICVYERAFLPSSEWMTIQINIKMIVEKQMSRGGGCFFSERFCESTKSVLRLRFLVTVPPLYGPGFHFIVLDDIWFHQFGC